MVTRILGLALALALLVATSAAAQVLYVGDSLGVGTAPYLRPQLEATPLTVDAKTSGPSAVGLDVLGATISPEHEVVIFDLGTNDDPGAPEALAANLAQAREIAAGDCLVVATLNRPPLNGVGVGGLNRAVTGFALSTPGVELVDWHGAVAGRPDLLVDGVHPTAAGYELRAELFADAIGACQGPRRPAAPKPPRPQPEAAAEPAEAEPAPAAPASRERDPVRALAVELARVVEIGTEFG